MGEGNISKLSAKGEYHALISEMRLGIMKVSIGPSI